MIYNALKMGHTTDSVIKGKDVILGEKKEKAIEKNQELYARVMSENRVIIAAKGMGELQYHTFLYSRGPFEN